jgi:hypothetical protein
MATKGNLPTKKSSGKAQAWSSEPRAGTLLGNARRYSVAQLAREFPALKNDHDDIASQAIEYALVGCKEPAALQSYVWTAARRLALKQKQARRADGAAVEPDDAADNGLPRSDEPDPETLLAEKQCPSVDRPPPVISESDRAKLEFLRRSIVSHLEAGISAGFLFRETGKTCKALRLMLEGHGLTVPGRFEHKVGSYVKRHAKLTPEGWVETAASVRARISAPGKQRRRVEHSGFRTSRGSVSPEALHARDRRREAARAIGNYALKLAGVSGTALNALVKPKRRRHAEFMERATLRIQKGIDAESALLNILASNPGATERKLRVLSKGTPIGGPKKLHELIEDLTRERRIIAKAQAGRGGTANRYYARDEVDPK